MVERHRLNRKRIMRDFVIKELSAVDSPAQRHALAVLVKRDANQQEQDDLDVSRIASFDNFEDAMRAIREADGFTQLQAMEEAARRYPELVKRYNDEGERIAKAAVRRVPTIPADVVRFDAAVRDIMARDGCGRLAAMERAVREQPRLFELYQAAAATLRPADERPAGTVVVG